MPRLALTAAAVLSVFAAQDVSAYQVHVGTFVCDGSQGPTPTGSLGTGLLKLTLDMGALTVSASGTYQNMQGNVSTTHIHKGSPTMNGGVMLPLQVTGGTTGSVFGGGNVTLADANTALSGGAYANIHSSVFPGGEIRGQVILPWQIWSLGSLASTGAVPAIECIGGFSSGTTNSLDLSNAPASSSAFLILGFTSLRAPFKGGILGPSPDQILPFITSASGTITLPYVLPTVPAGIQLWTQYWVQDAGVPSGFTSSDTMLGTTQ
ncbi:MAG: hypothetical protein ACI9EF_000538 [Pseudohongiellaceae bacterium]|jgi:hypothetical protein